MDEKEFKKTLRDVNNAPCVFAKAILRRCSSCSRAEKLFVGEREAVACKSPGARQLCSEVLEQLHQKAIFALHLQHAEAVLPHGKELKVQCGGLLGLQAVLLPQLAEAERVEDIYGLLTESVQDYGSTAALPYGEVMRGITHYLPRAKR